MSLAFQCQWMKSADDKS